MSEILLVFTKKRFKLFKWRDKIQTYYFVAHFIFNRNKILCIHVEALDIYFQLLSKMLIHFLTWVFIGQKCETLSIFTSWQKNVQISSPTKSVQYVQIAYSFYSK